MSFSENDTVKALVTLSVFAALAVAGCLQHTNSQKKEEQRDIQKQAFLSSDCHILTVKDESNKQAANIHFTPAESQELGKILHKEDSYARVFVESAVDKMTDPLYETQKEAIDSAFRRTFASGMAVNTDQDIESVIKVYQIFNGAIKRDNQEKVQTKTVGQPRISGLER